MGGELESIITTAKKSLDILEVHFPNNYHADLTVYFAKSGPTDGIFIHSGKTLIKFEQIVEKTQ